MNAPRDPATGHRLVRRRATHAWPLQHTVQHHVGAGHARPAPGGHAPHAAATPANAGQEKGKQRG
jgi:hypothetical protein